ncbi:MAG: hypothetical protein FJY92_11175 [Candidatus Hydrogenedentes bacterium]|nr:hypothetical protein [Candidatus Hydrogenedentota bacterium]
MNLHRCIHKANTARHVCTIAIAASCAFLIAGGTACPRGAYNPIIVPALFTCTIDNPYFPLVPGTSLSYEADTPDGFEKVETTVTHDTKTILGVTCVVVHDVARLDGEIIEDTIDWYAQDRFGNVWYFGEFSTTYDHGTPTGTKGSWEAGVDGAKPGVVMEACPRVGDTYRQEYLAGVAEDMADVLAIDTAASVPYGDFDRCVKTRDYTPLEPGVNEYKFYAPGIGLVLTKEDGVRVELVDINVE